MKTVKIYLLKHPETNEIKYVGKTTKSLNDRLKDHLSAKNKSHKTSWFLSLKKLGLIPIIELIEEVNNSNWQDREIYWIDFYLKQGYNLCNHTKGGDGRNGEKFSEETKKKMSEVRLGYKPKKESIEKQKKWIKEHRVIDETWRKNMSLANNNKGSKNPRATFTEEQVKEIKICLLTMSIKEVVEKFNSTYKRIYQIKSGKSWKNV